MNGQPINPGNKITFTDDALREAARLVHESLLASLPPPSECDHVFSDSFEEKMAVLLKRDRVRRIRRRITQRVVAVFLTLLIGASVWLAVDVEARAAVFNWVREVYENSIIYRFFNDDADMGFPTYRLEDIGDNYTLVEEIDNATFYSAFFLDAESKNWIMFEYQEIQEGSMIGYIGDENDFEHETVMINNLSGDFYGTTEEGGTNNLIWIDEDRMLVFTIDSNLCKDDLIGMAKKLY